MIQELACQHGYTLPFPLWFCVRLSSTTSNLYIQPLSSYPLYPLDSGRPAWGKNPKFTSFILLLLLQFSPPSNLSVHFFFVFSKLGQFDLFLLAKLGQSDTSTSQNRRGLPSICELLVSCCDLHALLDHVEVILVPNTVCTNWFHFCVGFVLFLFFQWLICSKI